MKTMKKVMMALFIVCACAIIAPNGIANSNPSEVSAATKKLSKKQQHKLYASTMKKYAVKVKESVSDPELYGDYDFSRYRVMYVFADIDKNGTDELIMRYRDPASGKYTGISTGYGENTSIYTIRNGKVRTVKEGSNWSPYCHDYYVRVYKGSKYIDFGFAHGYLDYAFSKFSKGYLSKKTVYSLTSYVSYETNKTVYYINNKKVSKNAFNKKYNALTNSTSKKKNKGYLMKIYK
ncbi:MAG: hypothetical protein Q4E53_13380 [Eubacteriales bacterium]|nr:hypothetical protein [Eubacteriales bacterium]